MKRFLVRLVSCTALVSAALLAVPKDAWAVTSVKPQLVYYTTAIAPVYGSSYPLTGRLDLEIFPDGTLRGYYHTSYYKLFVPVVGGRDGDYMWLDIGPSSVDLGLGAGPHGKLHVVGTTSQDGTFRGQVYPETAAVLSGLTANAFANPEVANDQYVLNAAPSDPEPTPSPSP